MSQQDSSNELQQLRSQVAALEQLLEVHESTVAKQSERLELSRRKAEQRADALRESEERFKTLVDHAPEAIVLLDADAGRFVDANENALQLFELSRDQLLERHSKVAISTVNWLARRRARVDVPQRYRRSAQFELNPQQLDRAKYLLIYAVPGLFFFLAFFVIYWRRRA